jgi:DNA-binding NarL/FixJ family response regulator
MENARPYRVFVVEDSRIARARIATLLGALDGLELAGYAADAEGAIARILAERPDAVLLDLHLEHGTGFDVLRSLRAQAPEIEVYMMTNFATPPYREHAARLGACDLFDKSFEFELLRDVLRRRARPEAIAA